MSCHGRNGEWNYHLQFQKLMAFLEDFKAITGFSISFFTNFTITLFSSIKLAFGGRLFWFSKIR